MAKQRDKAFPTPDAIVAFIRAQPGKVGTREIARQFGLKNADRAELKRILRELADEGVIAKRGKKIGETATVITPNGKRELEVLSLMTIHDQGGEEE